MVEIHELPKKLAKFSTIVKPDKIEAGWWAGAPSICKFNHQSILLAVRMREAMSPRGRRGYEIRILESKDGLNFTPIHHIKREDAKVPVFERPALVKSSDGKLWLFGCSEMDGYWGIWHLDPVNTPKDLDPTTLKPITLPLPKEFESTGEEKKKDQTHHSAFTIQFKDPFIFIDTKGKWHMFIIAFDKIERTYHYTSNNGEKWEICEPCPVIENIGWHNFFTRPSCVLPLAVGYLFVYEGSNIFWHDPVYNIATGLAYTPDLITFTDLTPKAPLIMSTTPSEYRTWRYSLWISQNEKIYVYFEATNSDGTNETRLSIVDF
jgi:hypothetical protein